MADIEAIKKEYNNLLQQLTAPELISNWSKFEELNKRKAHLEKIIAKGDEIQEIKNKIEENKEIIKAQEDLALVSLAEAELKELQENERKLEKEFEEILQNKGVSEKTAVIMEIRAGTGGEEAALFAADLHRMYARYAENQGWKAKILDSHPSETKGFKEVTFEIDGLGASEKLQNEAGVHRVQRIPVTEKAGRIHTSTASVAVLPKPKKAELKINPSDLRVEVSKASGPGGQNVNKRMTAVRIVHLPSGIAVTSFTERNLQQNKENAMAILEARLLERQKTREVQAVGEKRRAQIKGAERSDKIRTYNFPQDRVTDHRIGKSFHNIEGIMEGNLNPIVESLDRLEV